MEPTEFIWMNGKLVPWASAQVHVMTHALHYGDAVFEGIRAYKTDKGGAVFRLGEHIDRLIYSASVLHMEIPFSKDQLIAATIETLKACKLEQCYIRPLVFYGYGVMGLNPRNSPVETMIAAWPWGRYLGADAVDLKVSQYIRIHPKSLVTDAKISGHYVNSILSALEIKGTKYHECLLLDYEGNVAEGPGENLFIVKNGKLKTPKKGTILPGITRDTVSTIARRFDLELEEATIKLEEVFAAEEAFYTGTAAEVSPIRSLNDKLINKGDIGSITKKLQDEYTDVVYGRSAWAENYLTRF